MMKQMSRRRMLQTTVPALAGMVAWRPGAAEARRPVAGENSTPCVKTTAGAPGAEAGEKLLAAGGNAIDAAVAGALCGCITAPNSCGLGGYGGTMIVWLAKEKKATCIDFNSVAPAAATPGMFVDAKGAVAGNFHGWRAAGVPGVLAGMQFALNRYGSKSFREVAQPALALARAARPDPMFDGRALARMLGALVEHNSADSFYRGDIAQTIADAFRKHEGLVTAKDLAGYEALELEPYRLPWGDAAVLTAPLGSGGLAALQALAIVRALDWGRMPAGPERSHARLEALRLAWRDRLTLLGDPKFVAVPVRRLLSSEYAKELAGQVKRAVKTRRPIPMEVHEIEHGGTINVSSVDKAGNLVAVTLTHGSGYGARVVVEELGLVLGHGMSRFQPRPGHPNSVAPGKRPLHNMSPCLLQRDGRTVLAVGGVGGTRIPNAIFDFFTYCLAEGQSTASALEGPHLNCYGALTVQADDRWPKRDLEYFTTLGYEVKPFPGARLRAVEAG
jgi:gamma-glutamyltranspeptidase/glutathione hydrolase